MAFLLFGVSLLAGLRYFGPRVDLAHQKNVSNQMASVVQKSLWSFVSVNYRLPCPADGTLPNTSTNYGMEQPQGGGTCTITGANAVLPWKTLGIAQTASQDAWGNQLGYAVTALLTRGTPYKSAIPSSDAVKVTATASNTTSSYAYVLMSFGPDGGSYNLSGKQTPVNSSSKLTTTETQYEGNNRTAMTVGGLSSPFYSLTATGGATGGQWLLFEGSSQICTDVNGTSNNGTKAYCNASIPQNGQCGSGQVCTPTSTVTGLSVTSSSQTNNPNGVSSSASVISSGLSTAVLALGTPASGSSLVEISSAPTLGNSSQACSWLTTPLPLTTQTLRAYFEFSTAGATPGDGFTFTMLPAATDMSIGVPCGGTPYGKGSGNNTNEGSYIGFEAITDGGANGSVIAQPTVSGGKVTGISTASAQSGQPGQGYMWVPPVEITDTNASPGSGASAYVSQMQLYDIVVTNSGYGYIAAAGASPAPAVIVAPGGGAGYASVPVVTIETATATGCTSNCTNATGTAILTNGRVSALHITNAGGGYRRAPAVTLTGSAASGCSASGTCADAIGASATIDSLTGAVSGLFIVGDDNCGTCVADTGKVNSMAVTGVTLTSGGSHYLVSSGGAGYTTGTPTVFIQDVAPGNSGGKNATATATISGGAVTGITVTNPGSGYSSNVVVTVAGGGVGYATINQVTNGKVKSATFVNGGSGYPASTQFNFNFPEPLTCSNCTPAVFQATVNSSGVVSGISLVSGGSGYSSSYDKGNVAPITDATHVGAIVQATVNPDGTIASLTLPSSTTPQVPTVTVIPSPNEPYILTNGASGVPIVAANLSAAVNSAGIVTGLTINSVGAGYTLVPTINISAPTGCSTCAAQASIASMSVVGIQVTSRSGETFSAMPSVGLDLPTSLCTYVCIGASAAANVSITGITMAAQGSGYHQATTVVTVPPPNVYPKLGIEFRTYHHPSDPFYSDYGYHDDWGYFGSNTGASCNGTGTTYCDGTPISSVLSLPSTAQLTGVYGVNLPMPKSFYSTQSLTNIRHDDSTNCNGSGCVPQYMSALVVDALHHDDTYHYSTLATDNTAYTVSPSCDAAQGGNAATHGGGFVSGGGGIGGTLATVTAPAVGGCTYNGTTNDTTIITDNGPIVDSENGSSVLYHSVRVEMQRYCDPSCSSCGNQGTPGDNYIQVAAWLDCDSSALNNASCQDMTQNLLVTGSQVFSVTLTNVGSGYTAAPTVDIFGGGGTGATATASFDSNSKVLTGITVTAGGSGFVSVPKVTISAPASGTTATATAQISGLPLPASYISSAGSYVYAMNYCTIDPGATSWTSSQQGLTALDNILLGFTAGAGAATRGVLIRNLQVGTYN